MARNPRKSAGREFRERVLETSISLGLVGALWWGFKHAEHVSRCSTTGPANTSLARCTSHTLTAVVIHWVLIVGVGFAAGAILGIAIVSLIPRPKHT
jgi:ABC-type nitrate/sulfonate/bicarbonate transport system permease component